MLPNPKNALKIIGTGKGNPYQQAALIANA